MTRCTFLIALCLSAISPPVLADLPLTVEDLITDKGKVKLDVSLAYANTDHRNVSTGEPLLIQTGPTSFIALPTRIGENLGNNDTFVSTLGLRYGLTAQTELYTRASSFTSRQRNSGVSGTSTSSDSGFADAWVGVNHQFKPDDKTPALLGFAEIALTEKMREDRASFKSTMIGMTTYKAIDPIVFSLTGAYRFSQSRKDGEQNYKPGNLVLLNPSIAFAVNDQVTLSTGVQWTRRSADQRNGTRQGLAYTATDLLLGVGYGLDHENILNATFKVNASGNNGSELRMSWMHTF